MANPYVSKVVINGTTKLDLTADTVDAAHLQSGYTAHDKSGAPITGTLDVPTVQSIKSYSALSNGTFTIIPDSGYDGIEQVTLTVNVPSENFGVTVYQDGVYLYTGLTVSQSGHALTIGG